MHEGEGALEKPQDAGKGKPGEVKRWHMELALAGKQEKAWRKDAKRTIERYRDEKDRDESQFNILFSNVQTLAPSLYAKSPLPDVRRRYRDKDELGADIAEVLERAASYTLDAQDFDGVMDCAVLDTLLPGRCVTRVRYVPSFRAGTPAPEGVESAGVEPSAPPAETLAFEECEFEHVDWQDFRRGPGRRWDEVPWVAFRHRLTRAQVKELNEQIGEVIQLDYTPDEDEEDKPDSDTFQRATVWEIWDKQGRKVKWLSETHKDDFLREEEDPLRLKDFWPVPRPMYAVEDPGSMVPISEFKLYRDQAEELDRITLRITKIIEVLKVRGIAASSIAELWNLENAEDGEFAPAENLQELLANDGGLEKALWMFPVEKIIIVLKELYLQREQIKQTIYEIMGISDILRGNTQASETATAQSIKAQWGSLRLEKRQKEVQRYARDLIRIAVEIMAERFNPMTLQIMTGREVTDEMLQVMKQDGLRSFRIDIETDSTIASDQEADKQNVTQLIQAITGYIATVGPAVAEGMFPADAAKSILLAGVRRFKLGREVEDALDQIGGDDEQQQPQEPQGPTPEQVQANADAQAQQADMVKFQAEMQSKQAELQSKQQTDGAKLQADMARHRSEIELKMSQFTAELAQNQQQHEDKMALEYAKLGVVKENNERTHEQVQNQSGGD